MTLHVTFLDGTHSYIGGGLRCWDTYLFDPANSEQVALITEWEIITV